jgi:site-specific recombinase XerD
MLITYFKDSCTLARYRSGLANRYLENFIVWLESKGYRRFTIRRHVREVVHFADWAEAEGLGLRDLDRGALNRPCSQLAERNSLRYPCGKQRQICHSACLLIDFLEEVGAVESRPPHISTQEPALLFQFREWMRTQRGTLDITLNRYRLPIIDLLDDLGTEPSTFDAIGLREFLLRRVSCFSPGKSKNLATAVRMFLRFLIARGYCASGLEHSIPTVAKWRLSSLPKYLSIQDVECLINSCDQSSPLGARDRAILLLIARLGLRAGDVSALKFGDLLWEEGTLVISWQKSTSNTIATPAGSRRGDLVLSEAWSAPQCERSYLHHFDCPIRPNFSSGGRADRSSRNTPYRNQRTQQRLSSAAAFGGNPHACYMRAYHCLPLVRGSPKRG